MCGICGWIELAGDAPPDRPTLDRMNATLVHRGPDDRGSVVVPGGGVAMCRLSVIDVATGAQPMSGTDPAQWIVHNGEIYNFLELRRTLEARGHRFATRSDTEVILRSYEAWGEDCVERLDGMFAFGILRGAAPGRPARLFLARDRVGKKPLYYYQDARRLVFGSEIKALLEHPAVPRQVHRRALPLYLAHGYVPSPETMFAGIRQLPPGHTLSVEGHVREPARYWHVPAGPGRPAMRAHEAIAGVRDLLRQAVRRRLVSDVPLGAFLSGGIDSSAVVAVMAELLARPVKTFAIGFEGEPSFDELGWARRMAQACGAEHHEFVVRPDAFELLPRLVWHHDQPFGDSSAIPVFLVSRLAREHVTVALTGDGGDELFGGYDRFAAARVADAYGRLPRWAHRGLAAMVRGLPESTHYRGLVRRVRRFVENAPLPLAQRYLGWVGVFDPALVRELLAETQALDPVAHFDACFDAVRDVDPIGQLLYVNATTYLPDDLLVKTDRMTMANSLEARCPLLDRELLEFAGSMPSRLKVRGLTGKYVFKRAMQGLVPSEIIARPKHGFGVPVGRWFRTTLRDAVPGLLLDGAALGRGYFREAVLRRLVDEHQRGVRDHGHRLWTLLTLEMWHRIFIDRTVTVGPA